MINSAEFIFYFDRKQTSTVVVLCRDGMVGSDGELARKSASKGKGPAVDWKTD